MINKRLLAFKDFKDKGTDKDRDKDKDKGHIININDNQIEKADEEGNDERVLSKTRGFDGYKSGK